MRGGLTSAVVEERLAGGECEYYACIPSKALLWPMELAAEVDRMPGLELRQARPWTNREATSVQQVPKRLVVIGAGLVACEMSQALHALGAQETTVLVRGDRLLARAEPFAGPTVSEVWLRLLEQYGL